MTKPPPRKPKRTLAEHFAAMPRKKIDRAAVKLAESTMFALKCLWRGNGAGLRIDLRTGASSRWEDDFFNALDLAGIKLDREAYFQKRAPKGRRFS